MKRYTDHITGMKVVEVYDLSFLREKEHPYSWLKRHFLHFRLKLFIPSADIIYVADTSVGVDLVRYYFVPKEKITVDATLKSSSHKR